ncbi:MAG: NAD(P)/FAD-dependent oxidoreductase [Deltaproteobacteria bacterium]|nr:NAD(P)/FAD-dependent oxidoreductase [Deltaproteobacteria bacterium]
MANDFIIVGGGPSGCAAALFAARAKRKVALIQKGITPLMRSFQWLLPGLPQELGPFEWLSHMRSQIANIGFEIVDEEVTQAALGASVKQITTASGKMLEAPVIILATGCYDRHGFIEGESTFVGHGVFYNAWQDGPLCEGETVVVEGKNEEAMREVLYLSRFAKKIHFVIPALKPEGNEKIIHALHNNSKIEILPSASIKKISGEEKLESVSVLVAGEEKTIPAKCVFLYARTSKPQYEFLKGTIEISEEGAVMVDDRFMTSVPGVFACGDMLAGVPQLQFVSAAQGLVAAMHADRHFSTLNL